MQNFAFAAPLSIGASQFNVTAQVCSGRRGTATVWNKRSVVQMGSEANIAQKSAIVDSVKERLSSSQMIFAVPLDGMKVSDVYSLRRELPEGTTAVTVKNSLMRRAIADSEWEVVGDFLQQSNLWFFVNDDMKGSVAAYEKFAKSTKRSGIKGGGFDGQQCDQAGIQAIAALPSKIELITQFAVGVRMIPTKLGKTIKAIPTTVGRAIKLAVADEEGEGAPSE
ncbi:Ribosomal protein L10 [Gracilaria domingensis]|nr:Ribosomal protein L10 [Gracilaria domingensis]